MLTVENCILPCEYNEYCKHSFFKLYVIITNIKWKLHFLVINWSRPKALNYSKSGMHKLNTFTIHTTEGFYLKNRNDMAFFNISVLHERVVKI